MTLTSAAILVALSLPAMADHDIETITIVSQQSKSATSKQLADGNPINPDSASWLEAIPGAAVNRNGGISGVAQYRGLYGDRVSVKMNGHSIIGSGPNAMDAPMSYAVPTMIESMTAYRGIAPVYAGMDTLGGAIDIKLKNAELGSTSKFDVSGLALLGYQQQGSANTISSVINAGNKEQALLVYGNIQTSDNVDDASGREIPSTKYDKTQYGVDYRVAALSGLIGISFHKTDTGHSGTAALPMDINYVVADRFDVSGEHEVGAWQINWALGQLDSDHIMDNFTNRVNNMEKMHRSTNAFSNTFDFKLHVSTHTEFGHLTLGTDGYSSEHSAIITAPPVHMVPFLVKNFADVEDARVGVFAHIDKELDKGSLSVGLRIKQNTSDAGEVSHHGAMMNPNIMMLQSNFNNADRSQSETNYDFSANWTMDLSEHNQVLLGAGIKQKAPSYQERYLWMPMQSTGGLADGHVYIGNMELDSETAYQLNAGFSLQEQKFGIAPNVFYQKIDDYIQGVPSTNMAANMIGNMMSGMTPLQFSNVEAELYGMDMTMRYNYSDDLVLSGIASYVRGERTDIEDNLYRISAPNLKLDVTYYANNWQANFELDLYAKQDQVSELNSEKKTAGYGVVNTSAIYYLNQFAFEFGANNLFDKQYTNHLAGSNRVMMADLSLGEKLTATGRDLYLTVNYQF